METETLHAWDVSPEAARALQTQWAAHVREEPLAVENVRTVGGADISFEAHDDPRATPVCAGFVTLDAAALQVIARRGVRTVARFPYVPGLLSFREAPPLLEAWAGLRERPDALLCDGHGRAHPRRFGLACHLGLLLDLPTCGVAKSLLVGTHGPVPEAVGAWTPLKHRGEIIGAALRTRQNVAPVYVSVGHRIDLDSAIALVLRGTTRYRLPETTRHAHAFVNALRRDPALNENGGKDTASPN